MLNLLSVIVNMVDIHARQPLAGHPVYCAAKAGLDMLTRSLAKELGPEVRVNGVAPGPILWPEAEMEQSAKDAIVRRTALKRVGCPDDIVKTILFFVRLVTQPFERSEVRMRHCEARSDEAISVGFLCGLSRSSEARYGCVIASDSEAIW